MVSVLLLPEINIRWFKEKHSSGLPQRPGRWVVGAGGVELWFGLTAFLWKWSEGKEKKKKKGTRQQGESQMWRGPARRSKWWNHNTPFLPSLSVRAVIGRAERAWWNFPPDTNCAGRLQSRCHLIWTACRWQARTTKTAYFMPREFLWRLSFHLSQVMKAAGLWDSCFGFFFLLCMQITLIYKRHIGPWKSSSASLTCLWRS